MTTEYRKKLDEAANQSIGQRDMYELHEADARVRQFKLGAQFVLDNPPDEFVKRADVQALVEAANTLKNNTHALISGHEDAIRSDYGNTNIECVIQSLGYLHEALAPFRKEGQGE